MPEPSAKALGLPDAAMALRILTAEAVGITTPEALRKNRRFAILGCAVVAAMLPTIDPLTMILEMIPLIILYELSIVLAQFVGRPPAEAQSDGE